MSETKSALDDLLQASIQSSMLCVCRGCGSTANYRGEADKINAAMKEFYALHERCYQHTATTMKGKDRG